ncbi:glucosaminidase domain-containing protein [Parapedobacter koreensis]|uniref:Peptidoglycan hydrolase n=1 Tax=Parapedobacter koreensis TaxID=332977 RepID=A0A1H7T8R1_9SPHI|nr:glucosaminidase domain-containing protein [Parapedobacter koreensis]SEL80905.1 Flagellum-specific peptidoglycan hydrolase FlgJ [Parapedobacter koreensis]
MKGQLYALLTVLLFTSCLSKHDVLQNPRVSRRPVPTRSTQPTRTPSVAPAKPSISYTSTSGYEYIDRYKDVAISEMDKYGIPASIKLAQALLESGNGNSTLAREANNHFGIKCTPEWIGGKTYQDDDRRDDCFRVYEHAEDSFKDHSQFLLRKRYESLFELDKDDYKGWAKGLKSAGYATNPRYADMLIDLIERYQLHQYDRAESRNEKIRREEVVQTEIVENKPEELQVAQAKAPVRIDIHEVKQGDTLAEIARKYGMSTADLMDLNGLKTESLFVGQLILVSQ